MAKAVLIFPHQLFEHHPCLDKKLPIYLIEHPRFFTNFTFHKQKIMLHRASMKAYYDLLIKNRHDVTYINFTEAQKLFTLLKKNNIKEINYCDVSDVELDKQLNKEAKKNNLTINIIDSPAFLTPIDLFKKMFKNKKNYLMNSFYIKQRKRLNILITKDKKPVGGSWSFDKDNRKPLPENIKVPKIWTPRENNYTKEATTYTQKHFKKNYGSLENFIYPVTHADAKKWLQNFLKHRLALFGDYEDAIDQTYPFLFHSLLSPLLNTGLLTPDYVVQETLKFSKKEKVPLNSLEGFIRQIIGWREFVHCVYRLEEKNERKNYFNHTNKLPKSFYDGSTTLEPVDSTIKKVLTYAYAHHIERLMILGNILLLCCIDPDEIYTWFMELFIDAYDWVMVPNVYSMSQFADGGLMTTKPYFSSSNYVLKMSNYQKNRWNKIWDALFWNFMHEHRKKLAKNPRLALLMGQLKRMKPATLKKHQEVAQKFLEKII